MLLVKNTNILVKAALFNVNICTTACNLTKKEKSSIQPFLQFHNNSLTPFQYNNNTLDNTEANNCSADSLCSFLPHPVHHYIDNYLSQFIVDIAATDACLLACLPSGIFHLSCTDTGISPMGSTGGGVGL